MTSHTPGPWRDEPTNGAKLSYVVVSTVQGSNGSTVVIGQCSGPDKEANARLIALAPEMLAELRRSLAFVREMKTALRVAGWTDTVQFTTAEMREQSLCSLIERAATTSSGTSPIRQRGEGEC